MLGWFKILIYMHVVRSLLTRRATTRVRMSALVQQSVPAENTLQVALCQLLVGSDKIANIENASNSIDATGSAKMVVLPECWNSPYGITSFPIYAEEVPNVGGTVDKEKSPSIEMLVRKAKERQQWIIGGSIPERDGDSLFNTCIIVNDEGKIVGKHRKVHLFDINVPGKITFKESDSLSPGGSSTIVDTPWGKVGVGICYDIRFPEYATILRQQGARLLVYPGAFNMVTGPAHWELLQRARSVDNQVFTLTCSPARDKSNSGGYIAWGHSTIVSPWGEIVATTEEDQAVVIATLDLTKIDEMRENIPCWTQKRHDIYETISK